jgi:ABC-type transport system substrate-binding protein
MRPSRSRLWSAVIVLAVLLALSGPALPRVQAQAGGALVLGLDQEPPTLDPHASPSAAGSTDSSCG